MGQVNGTTERAIVAIAQSVQIDITGISEKSRTEKPIAVESGLHARTHGGKIQIIGGLVQDRYAIDRSMAGIPMLASAARAAENVPSHRRI